MPCDRPSSKKQLRWAFAAEERGELPKGTARRWARKHREKKKGNVRTKILKSSARVAEDIPTALATGATHVSVPKITVQYQPTPIKREVMPDFPYTVPLTLGAVGGLFGAALGPLFAGGKEVAYPSGAKEVRTTWGDIGRAVGTGALSGVALGGGIGLIMAIGQYLYNKLNKKKTVVYYAETNPPMVYPVSEPAT